MVFSSPLFLFVFLPLIYFLVLLFQKNINIQNFILTLVSIFFYAWGEPAFTIVLFVSIIANYFVARLIGWRQQSNCLGKTLLIICILLNLGLLCVMKYTGFIIANINFVFSINIPEPQIKLPIGISFFTFQIISYVIDVYRKEVAIQRNPIKLLLYVSFFPQLMAGPIIKYHDIEGMLSKRKITLTDAATGIRRFIIGLSKKLLLANALGNMANVVFRLEQKDLSMPLAWIGAVSYTMQIYFDFSGYSDMAIGLGRMMGFKFKENFNYPLVAIGIQDFWRRWHISLSTWFKEYVYIPLGGNRKGKLREGINKLTVFFLTGLWHGANWTFIIWGLFHGLFITLEAYGVIKLKKIPKPIAWIYTMMVVVVGFVMFRADTMMQGWHIILAMFSGKLAFGASQSYLLRMFYPSNIVILCVAILAATPLTAFVKERMIVNTEMLRCKAAELTGFVTSLALFCICILNLATTGYNPFIYFRF